MAVAASVKRLAAHFQLWSGAEGGRQAGRMRGMDEKKKRDERQDWSMGFPTVDHRVREDGGGPERIFHLSVLLDVYLPLPSYIM